MLNTLQNLCLGNNYNLLDDSIKKVSTESMSIEQANAILQSWIEKQSGNDVIHTNLVKQACEFIVTHDDELETGLAMAEILIPLGCDRYTIAASLLYPSLASRPTLSKALSEQFDRSLYKLVSGVIKMRAMHQAHAQSSKETGQQNQIDNLRKMLLAMVDDIRVVLIKLSDRLIALKNSKQANSDQQKRIAKEVLDFYVPLANRLGLGQLKWQLEDWSFRYLDPETYQTIKKALNKRRPEREQQIHDMIAKLKVLLKPIHLSSTSITGRAKHIYSIHRKMQRKQLPFQELYDTNALRILVPTIDNCYSVLSIVHAEWPHIQAEFDDYIANPKPNGYQSIHTAISKPDGSPVEIQIRTFEMHEQAELGVAAHWKYKENNTKQSTYEDKIAWLRDVLDWQQSYNEAEEKDNLYQQAFADRVYVFSPNSDVFDLPAGATALDFAYLVHTNVGHRCKGAKINGKLTPLTQPLKTGDRVDVVTGKDNQPSRDWMRKELGFLTTMHAIRKVRHWFHKQDLEKHIRTGITLWEKAARQKGYKKSDLLPIAKHFNFKDENGLYAALGTGDLQIGNVLQQLKPAEEQKPIEAVKKITTNQPSTTGQFDLADGNSNMLLTQLAKCCNPIPGDEIMGYITQGRGITIHQSTCHNIAKALSDRPEKVIEINWKNKTDTAYRLKLSIISEDHPGLLNDISSLITHMKLSILALQSFVHEKEKTAHIQLTLSLKSRDMVKVLVQRIRQIYGVIRVERS